MRATEEKTTDTTTAFSKMINQVNPVDTSLPKCERVFHEAIKAWEKKYPNGHLNDKDSPDTLWMYSYDEKVGRGIAFLQRRRRLIERQPAEQASMTERLPDSPPPGYLEACESSFSSQIDEEIDELTEGYWENAHEILLLEDERPRVTPDLEKFDILRDNYDRHGRSYLWMYDSEFCADSGRCCARLCGCCEKPLLTYQRPHPYHYDHKSVVNIRGHCTAECPCCIRVQRRYEPHPDLPEPRF